LYSTFVISIYDQWLLVTAGHCIEEIDATIRKGYKIERSRLVDTMGLGAKSSEPIPFDLEGSSRMKLSENEKYDYGLIYVNDMYRSLLEKNGVEALTEQVWQLQPKIIDSFHLIGVPHEFSEFKSEELLITTTMHVIDEIPERPPEFEQTEAPTFYGKIRIGDSMKTITGMSGGPIFSIRTSQNGEMKYWLHAVQSRWIPSKRYIAACLMRPFGIFIKEVMDGKHRHLYFAEAGW